MSTSHVDSTTTVKRDPANKTAGHRSRPFVSVLLVALFGVPAVIIGLRLLLYFTPDSRWLAQWLTTVLFCAVAPGMAVGYGYKVVKRVGFVIWHVATTIALAGASVSFGLSVGWRHDGERWWRRLPDIWTMPGAAVVVYVIGALFLTLTWWMYRIDSFRAATGAKGTGDGGLSELLGVPAGVTVRQGSIEVDEYATTAILDHSTVPAAKVAGALPAMVEKAKAIRGRSTMIPDERGGSSTVRIVRNDPMKDWRVWPGLSHPGLSFAYPFRTAYYSTGEAQWYSFAQTPDPDVLPPSPVVPKFRSTNDAHLGRQGATRSGKSGDIQNEAAEALSRNDCILILANAAKLMQDSGWCLDMVGLAADSKDRAQLLFAGIRALGEYRSDIMGDPRLQGRHRAWSPLTYEELGFAALLVQVDEGDMLLSGADVTWLSTKGLSLGVYDSVSISRAVTDGMASTLRSAMPVWKAFGAGQDYDKGFALSEETIAAGASPESFGTRFPGAHYLDKANGVAESKYPIDSRSYHSKKDFSELRRAVENARATFTPATFTPGEIEVLKRVGTWDACQPKVILFGAFDKADRLQATAGDVLPPRTIEGTATDMTKTLDMSQVPDRSDTGDPELDKLMESPPENFDDLERQYGALPPASEPLPSLSDPDQDGGKLSDASAKPAPENADHAVAEFEAALIRMADRGVSEFSNSDVMDEMTVRFKPYEVSKRFTGLCDEGKFLQPPGLRIERVPNKRGRFMLTRLSPPPGVTPRS